MINNRSKGDAMYAMSTRLAAVCVLTLALSGCRPGETPGTHVAAWSTLEATQRHPIVVSQQPARTNIRVARGANGLTPNQRAQVIDFLDRYRGGDTGNSRMTISVPTGAPNEVAALHAAADLRYLLRDYGLDDTRVSVQPYHSDRDHRPPIRISYDRFVAEAPECGNWSANVSDDPRNLPYPNLGCATQRNFAMQVANPADLLGPRSMTPASAERRHVGWEKYVKGDSTISKKDGDEKVQVKGAN